MPGGASKTGEDIQLSQLHDLCGTANRDTPLKLSFKVRGGKTPTQNQNLSELLASSLLKDLGQTFKRVVVSGSRSCWEHD